MEDRENPEDKVCQHMLFSERTHGPLSSGTFSAASTLSSKGPNEIMGSGSWSQAYPQSCPQWPFLCLTIPSFSELTLTFTGTRVLKFFLYESRTWRLPDMQKVPGHAGAGPAPGAEAVQ